MNFITGAGGFLQTMINGYPGFRITENGLLFNPRCPEGATYIKMRQLHYLNLHFNVFFSCESSSKGNLASKVTIESSGKLPLSLRLMKGELSMSLGKRVVEGKVVEIDLNHLRTKYGSTILLLSKEM